MCPTGPIKDLMDEAGSVSSSARSVEVAGRAEARGRVWVALSRCVFPARSGPWFQAQCAMANMADIKNTL